MPGKWKKKSMGKLSALQEFQLGSDVEPEELRERSKNLEATFGKERTEEEETAELLANDPNYDPELEDALYNRGGKRWPGRSHKRRRRKSRRKSKRKSTKKRRRKRRKSTKKKRRRRRR